MAKIQSPVWNIIRGSIAGTTYMSGPTGQIIARARTAPVQPTTPVKTDAQNAWIFAQASWEAQSPQVRQDWDDYARTVTFQGPISTYQLPGRQLFQGALALQKFISAQGLANPISILTAPPLPGFLLPINVSIAAPAGPGTGIGINLTADANDDTCFLMQISVDTGPTRNFWKGPYVSGSAQAAVVPANTSTLIDFLGLRLGSVHHFRVKAVSSDIGPRLSTEYFLRGTSVTVGP